MPPSSIEPAVVTNMELPSASRAESAVGRVGPHRSSQHYSPVDADDDDHRRRRPNNVVFAPPMMLPPPPASSDRNRDSTPTPPTAPLLLPPASHIAPHQQTHRGTPSARYHHHDNEGDTRDHAQQQHYHQGQQQQHHQSHAQYDHHLPLQLPPPHERAMLQALPANAETGDIRNVKLPDLRELTQPLLSKRPLFYQNTSEQRQSQVPSSAGQASTSPSLGHHRYPASSYTRLAAESPRQNPMSQSMSSFDARISMQREPHRHEYPNTAEYQASCESQPHNNVQDHSTENNLREQDLSQKHTVALHAPLRLAEKRKADIAPPPGSSVAAYSSLLTPFIYKLYCLVSDDSTNGLCHWSRNGDSFVVPDPTLFAATVLPQYFKHNQFPSFVRQLNKYRFHKLMPGTFVFGHQNFLRDRPELLPDIVRQRSPERASGSLPNLHNSSSGNADLVGDTTDPVKANLNSLDAPSHHASMHSPHYPASVSVDQHVLTTPETGPGMKRRRFSMPTGLGGPYPISGTKEQNCTQREDFHVEDGEGLGMDRTSGAYPKPAVSEDGPTRSFARLCAQVDSLINEREIFISRVSALEERVLNMSRKISELEDSVQRRSN